MSISHPESHVLLTAAPQGKYYSYPFHIIIIIIIYAISRSGIQCPERWSNLLKVTWLGGAWNSNLLCLTPRSRFGIDGGEWAVDSTD